MLRFKDPSRLRAKKIVFEDVYLAQDSATLEQLKELSSKRLNVELINEKSSLTDAIAREMSGGLTSQCEQDIQKLELYLPLLENLVQHVDLIGDNPKVNRWTSDLRIRWTSTLSSSSFFNLGPRFFQINNLRFELGMVLFFYGAMLREWASEVLVTDLVQSAAQLTKAAGIYQYLAHEVLPSLQPALGPEGPPEATTSFSSILSFICLAEAQMVAIMKAEERGTAVALLAKLHYGVVELLDEATVIYCSAAKVCKDISTRLMDYISSSKVVHQLRSYKYFAEAQKADGEIGIAIALIRHALSNVQRNTGGEESWRLAIKQERDNLTGLLRKYEHENDFVWREKIPFDHDLPSLQGQRIVNCKPYHPQRWERTLALKI